MANKSLGGLFGTDKPAELGREAVRRENLTPSQQQLVDRLADPVIRDRYKELRKYHRVPQDLDEIWAWVWLGSVLAEKHAAPAKRGPKPGKMWYSNDKRILDTIMMVAAQTRINPKRLITPIVKVLTKKGVFKLHENPETHKKRLKRQLRKQSDQVPKRSRMIAEVLLGHNSRQKTMSK